MSGKVALISGANKGIGKEVAKQLGKHGFKVYIGSRDLARGQSAAAELAKDNVDAVAIQLDVTSQESVDKAISHIAQSEGKLNVLINNAGIVNERGITFDTTDIEKVEETFQTNFFGPLRLTKAASGLLEKTVDSRLINVSSTLGSLTNATTPEFADFRFLGYGSSKAALNMLTLFSAKALGKNGVSVNSICPGYVATDINDNQGYRTVEQGASIVVKLATEEKPPTGGFFNEAGVIPW